MAIESCEKECVFFKKFFSRNKCRLTLDNMIPFCGQKLSCEDCNLNRNYKCTARDCLHSFRKVKGGVDY